MSDHIYLLGAGGHARVVVALLDALGRPVGGVFDDDPDREGANVGGYPVLGPLPARPEDIPGALVLAVGHNATRAMLARRLDARVQWADALVHPAATVAPGVRLGAGTVVFAGAIVQPGAAVGRHVIVNTAATADHDCRLGDFVHLAPGVHLAGGVTVEEGGFLGIGAVAVPGRHVGAWSIVGAGGVVTRDLPAHATAVGAPARVIKRHTTE